jgi:hypothetical protein
MRAVVDAFEHRQWPIHDDAALRNHGVEALVLLAKHFSPLTSMAKFDLEEAKRQYGRAKMEMRTTPFFTMNFKDFWGHLSIHYDEHMTGFPDLLILARVVLMIVCDSACCEVGFSALNRTQTQSRSNLKVSTIREVLTTHFLGDPIKEFKPGPIYEKWIDLPFAKGKNNSRGREFHSMMRRVVKSISARGEGESPTA